MRASALLLLLLLAVVAPPWAAVAGAARVLSLSDVHVRAFTLDLLPPASSQPEPRTTPAQAPDALVQAPLPVPVSETTPSLPPTPDVFLVIGVKSRVLRGTDARRAIRETWAAPSSTAALGVRVVFLGCEPDLSVLPSDGISEARDAIAREKATHHDFWTDELQCVDSFFTLVDKTVAFFDVALQTFPTLAYAMVVDDDAYVRVDRLVALLQSDRIPNERFYGGNAAEMRQRKPTKPIRNPESRYYLPTEMYPIDELPPFVAGAHYVFSQDVVGFVARNRHELRGLKGLDDVTMALWALALGIQPTFLPEFQIVRMSNCTEELISYADMSPDAIQSAHANLAHGRPFCDGYEQHKWLKQYNTVTFDLEGDDEDESTGEGDVLFQWDIELDPGSSRLRILTDITIARENIHLFYYPASGPYSSAFCNDVLPLLEAKLSILVGTNFCRHHRKVLLRFLESHDVSMPSLRPLLTVARHNLERDAIDDASNATKHVLLVRVIAPDEMQAVFVLAECLMAAVHSDKHIVVVNEDDPSHTPSIVVAVIQAQADDLDVSAISSLADQYNDQRTKLIVLSADGKGLSTSHSDPRVVMITSDRTTNARSHLYLPQVSVVLAGAIRYSPMSLLHPVESTEPQSQSFAAFHGKHCRLEHHRKMLELLKETDTLGACENHASAPSPTSQTPTDDRIDLFGGYKFVIAFEDDLATAPGFISEGIAMAFLAGSVPIYMGHSETVSRLFNPKAFIDCARFASLEECADYVKQVHSSPTEYQALRDEPPVVNMTAFMEAFSWHPQVADMGATGGYDGVLIRDHLHQLLRES